MTPLFAALYTVAGICLVVGLIELVVARRARNPGPHLAFGLTCLAAAANALVEPLAYRAPTPDAYSAAFKLQIGIQIAWWFSLVWFLIRYTGTVRRRLTGLVLIGLTLSALIHLLSPHGMLYSDVTGLHVVDLPWGESIHIAQAQPNPLRIVGDLTIFCLIILVVDSCIRLAGAGQRRRALLLGASAGLLLVTLVHGSLVDLLIVDSPYLMSFAFLALILLSGYDLLVEVIRTSELTQEVAANERQLRLMTDALPVFIGYIDREERIRFNNAVSEDWLGRPRAEINGQTLLEALGAEDYASVARHLHTALAGQAASFEGRISNRALPERHLQVELVPDVAEGQVEGCYVLAQDITERKAAEEAQYRNVRELAALKARLERENLILKQDVGVERGYSEIIGDSQAIRYVLHKLEQVASTEATVLIEGETGVGKELVARAIHKASERKDKLFLKVNCATLPANLIESELFGHVRGAFTGAHSAREGRFEVAHQGTLFLDEIGDLPLDLQSRLLRVLEDGELERLGSSRTLSVDVRVIAATNRDLRQEAAAGRFREDLFFRLNVYPITVPPLRQRTEDIPQLVRYFAEIYARRFGKHITEIPGSLVKELQEYGWPGNVRELRHLVERAVIVAPGEVLRLPEPIGAHSDPQATPREGSRTLEEIEREHIVSVLNDTGGQVAGGGGAAEILGVPPSTLRSRMKKLGIQIQHQATKTRSDSAAD